MKPILDEFEFTEQHTSVSSSVDKLITSRSGRGILDDEILEETRDRTSKKLYANNYRARLFFARELAKKIDLIFEGREGVRGAMVTIAPLEYTVTLTEARDFNVEGLTATVRETLGTENYIGLVEGAYYPRSQILGKPMVSWHAHCVVWDSDYLELEQHIDYLNEINRAAIPGSGAFHIRTLTPKDARKRAYYISKGQVRQYNAFTVRRPEIGWDEQVMIHEKSFNQKTSMRPGNAVKMMKVMAGRTLPELSMAGGEGHRLLKRVFRTTVDEIEADDERIRKSLVRII